MEETKENYSEELVGTFPEELKKELIEKLDLFDKEGGEHYIVDNYHQYLWSMKYLYELSIKHLAKEQTAEFWQSIEVSEFVIKLNQIPTLSKVLSRYIISLDPDIEALHLITKSYFQTIKKRITHK